MYAYDRVVKAMIGAVELAPRLILEDYYDRKTLWKPNYSGDGKDIVTPTDLKVQKAQAAHLLKALPDMYLCGEEEGLKSVVPLTGEAIILDPIDGTWAWRRGEPYGVASMMTYVRNGELMAAVLMDVYAGIIYAVSPLWDGVRVMRPFASPHDIIRPWLTMSSQEAATKVLMIRDMIEKIAVARPIIDANWFRGYTAKRGSSGLEVARLAVEDFLGGLLAPAENVTPWDTNLARCIARYAGLCMYRIDGKRLVAEPDYEVVTTVGEEKLPYIMVPHSLRDRLIEDWWPSLFG